MVSGVGCYSRALALFSLQVLKKGNGFKNSGVFTVGLQVSALICSKAIGFRSSIELKSHKAIGPPPPQKKKRYPMIF